jgi:hypothetical protein
VTPTRRWLVRRFDEHGVRVEQLLPDGFEKLSLPDVPIRGRPKTRFLARLAVHLGLARLLQRVALAQYPAFILLAHKDTGR